MENITDILASGENDTTTEPNITLITAVFGGIIGIIGAITTYLLKSHIQRSSCYSGKCFDCVCVDDEEKQEVERTLQRVRTEKKRRESEQLEPIHQSLEEVRVSIINEEENNENVYDKLNKEIII